MELLQLWLSVAAAAVPMVQGVDAHFVLSTLHFGVTNLPSSAITWLFTILILLQGFVKRTKVGVYSMQQVWERAPAQREIMAAFLSDSRIKYELGTSKLALSSRDLDILVKKAIQALVHSLQVSAPAPLVHDSSVLNMSELVALTRFKLIQQWVSISGWAHNSGLATVYSQQ